jgi:hypothetical protein
MIMFCYENHPREVEVTREGGLKRERVAEGMVFRT